MTDKDASTFLEEINLLAKFSDKSQLEGIKIHKEAADIIQQAALNLFNKGLISQKDGGYLTDSGLEAADHLTHLLNALN